MNKSSWFYILGTLLFILVAINPGEIFFNKDSDKNTLHLYFWSNYVEESIIQDFEKETGLKIKYDEFDSNDTLEAKILSGTISYDLVMPTVYTLNRQKNAYERLDKSKIPNLSNVSEFIKNKLDGYPNANDYTVNFVWGLTGIGVNLTEVNKIMPNAPLDSLALIFDPAIASKLSKCGIYVLDSADDMIPAALSYLGKNPNSTNNADLLAAKKLLISARPYIKKFTSSDYVQALANGDACVAIGWSGDIMQARDTAVLARNGVDIKFFIPKEGSQLFFDQLAIPENAKNKEGAYKFIDFILRPEISSRISNSLRYHTAIFSPSNDNKDVIDIDLNFSDKNIDGLYLIRSHDIIMNRKISKIFMESKLGRNSKIG